MTACAIRSFKLPVGFCHSSLTKTSAQLGGTTFMRRTRDVFPIARRTSVTPAVLQVRRDDRGRAEEVGRGSAARVLRMQRRAPGGKRGRGGAVGGCHVQGPPECRGPGCHNGRRCEVRCPPRRRCPPR